MNDDFSKYGFIDTLRDEAKSVKDCFTTFSFQSIFIYFGIIGFILKFQDDVPFITAASGLASFLMAIISRIGTYKYGTANRNYGFELHKFTSAKRYLHPMSWEEGLRNWRIIQASIFKSLFYESGINKNYLRPKYKKRYKIINKRIKEVQKKKKYIKEGIDRINNKEYIWFNVKSNIIGKTTYYAGSYLRTMINVNLFLSFVACAPSILLYAKSISNETLIQNHPNIREISYWMLIGTLILLMILLIWYRIIYRRLKHLEEGFLSIYSCGVIWNLIEICHNLAIVKTEGCITNYICYISKLSDKISKNPLNVLDWINRLEKHVRKKTG